MKSDGEQWPWRTVAMENKDGVTHTEVLGSLPTSNEEVL